MKNLAIFASGSGTNAENLIRYFNQKECGRVVLVVSNKADAPVLERASRLGVPTVVCTRTELAETDHIPTLLHERKVDFVVLAGFLLRIPDNLLQAYPGRIVNIHPALLPKFGGKGMYGDKVHEAVVAAGETTTGITIHAVDAHYDEGDVLFQASCPVLPSDTPQEVAQKVHALEYKYYPVVVEQLLSII